MWTIGREREKAHSDKFVRKSDQRALLHPVIDAVHDLKDGSAGPDKFVAVAYDAMVRGDSGVWQDTANWIRRVGREYPTACAIWDKLANHSSWQVRWRVACCLYAHIDTRQSDCLFEQLRVDRSAKVRGFAEDRHSHPPRGP